MRFALTLCFSSLRNLSCLSSTTKEHVPSGRLNKPKSHVSEISVIHVRVVAADGVDDDDDVMVHQTRGDISKASVPANRSNEGQKMT
jgi:hypothetical protein